MKCVLWLLVGCAVLFLGVPASANSINWLIQPSPGERIAFNVVDFSMARNYDLDADDSPVEGVQDVNDLPGSGAVLGAQVIDRAQIGAGGIGGHLLGETEDRWSVVEMKEIVGDPNSTITYWSATADPTYEVVGLMYGGVDTYVEVDPFSTTVLSAGIFMDIYLQPKGTFDSSLGSAGRLAFDQYEGVGYDAAGDPIGTLLMRLESTDWVQPLGGAASDVDGDGDPDGDFLTVYEPASTPVGAGEGVSSMFLDLVGGAWRTGPVGAMTLEAPVSYFPNGDPRFGTSPYGDLYEDQNLDPALSGPSDWVMTSEDPYRAQVSTVVVPEPVTAAGLLLAVVGLGRYYRRRRRESR